MAIIKQDYGVLSSDNYFPRSEANILCAKNLLVQPYLNKYTYPVTNNGITFTLNPDYTITANGTATADAPLSLSTRVDNDTTLKLKKGNYILSENPFPSDSTIDIRIATTKNGVYSIIANTYGKELKFSITDDELVSGKDYCATMVQFIVKSGKTINNLTFKPMIRLATDLDDTYEPYAMTNRELTEKSIGFVSVPISGIVLDKQDGTNGWYYGYKTDLGLPAGATPIGISETSFTADYIVSVSSVYGIIVRSYKTMTIGVNRYVLVFYYIP